MPKPAYLDTAKPLDERVRDLVSRLTTEEKIGLLPTRQEAVPRLGIPAYSVGGEGAHGLLVRRTNDQTPSAATTVFPQPIGLACTWDAELMERVGDVIGEEARAYYEQDGRSRWLTLWFPTIDMERDPRWGRTEEAYGEDPFLAGKLAAALIRGAQQVKGDAARMACAPKHFYGNNVERNRVSVSTELSERAKREYYLRVFQTAYTEGGALSMMTAYNEINGVPCIVNPEINGIVRGEWGFEGFVACDGGDFAQTVTHHRYCETHAESIALSLKAGMDSFTDKAELVMSAAKEALIQKLISEEDLDRAVFRSLRVRFRLGQFDPDEGSPYFGGVLCGPEHSATALEAAQKSVVLLQNDGALPLDPAACGKVLVLGDLAETNMPDWYSGKPPHAVTPLEAIRAFVPDAQFMTVRDLCTITREEADGSVSSLCVDDDGNVTFGCETGTVFEECDWGFTTVTFQNIKTGKYLALRQDGTLSCVSEKVWGWFTFERFHRDEETGRFIPHADTFNDGMTDENKAAANRLLSALRCEVLDGVSPAVDTASRCDTVIVVLGNHPLLNGRECFDRPDIAFPKRWRTLLRRLSEVSGNVILTLIAGYPYAFPEDAKLVRAVLYTAHDEQDLGTAVAESLFGKNNPAGRLPMTWYLSQDDLPDMDDYDLINHPRTYQYFDKPVQYPFGYGLSYTTFTYTGFSADPDGDGFSLFCAVRNAGTRAGDEVVQFYVTCKGEMTVRGKRETLPRRRLCGFERVSLKPGELKHVSLRVPRDELAFYNEETGRMQVVPGLYLFSVGASSEDIRAETEIKI
jgi:beta-glucosidase